MRKSIDLKHRKLISRYPCDARSFFRCQFHYSVFNAHLIIKRSESVSSLTSERVQIAPWRLTVRGAQVRSTKDAVRTCATKEYICGVLQMQGIFCFYDPSLVREERPLALDAQLVGLLHSFIKIGHFRIENERKVCENVFS